MIVPLILLDPPKPQCILLAEQVRCRDPIVPDHCGGRFRKKAVIPSWASRNRAFSVMIGTARS